LTKPFARGCVLVAVVCGALASPGLARAADPLGLDELSAEVGGDIQSALTEADAVAPRTSAAAEPVVSQAMATISKATAVPTVPAPPATPTEPSAPPPAAPTASAPSEDAGGLMPQSAAPPTPLGGPAAAPSAPATTATPLESAAAEVWTAIAEALAPVFPAEPQHPAVTSRTRPSLASPERESSLPGVSRGRDASVVPTASAPVPAIAFETPRAAPRGEGSAARSPPRGNGGDKAPAGAVVPQRPLPPAPPPQGPDLGSPIQTGGQGPLMPLVVAALAAAFALFGFQRHARLVPRSAFRKPRRVVLEVWQPG
jgi:hypothetical protein